VRGSRKGTMTLALSIETNSRSCKAVEEMIVRVIGDRGEEFRTQLMTTDDSTEFFDILGGGVEPVTLRGNSPSALTRAFNHYLKFFCNSHVSWCGSRIDLPEELPKVRPVVRVSTPFQYRYYFNYCTFSYSMAFWDWARWEKEIDWMALAGINLPLAITGQEAIWQRVYTRMGLSDADLKEFFAGPAFLAWGWMGNLDGWGGPTTQEWIDQQRELQTKILNRQRGLGMKPVLPAFTGHVPPALIKKYPNAQIKQLHDWAENFTGTYFLDPLDPMFQRIGHAFIEEQQAMYGVDTYGSEHFYSCDSFNENIPPSNDPVYLTSVSENLYQAMAGADDRAVWVMQAWMFHFNPDDPGFWKMPQIHALLDAVPDERMIVLDLQSESHPLWRKTEAFCGKPWIWCFLHNFGGHRSMYGNYDHLPADLHASLQDEKRGQLVGMGLTPEGIETNPVLYDLATDLMWQRDLLDTDQWLHDYTSRRYGLTTTAITRAWDVLRKTVYDRPRGLGGTSCTLINLSPRLGSERATLSYSPRNLVPAWEMLCDVAKKFKAVDPFRYDLVDVARQVLSDFAATLHSRAIAAYLRKDSDAFRQHSAAFINLLYDIDMLLCTRSEFMLGAWLQSAKRGAMNDEDLALREWNARALVTVWGRDQKSMLRDYARKEWGGLLKDFYAYRWQVFFDELMTCVKAARDYEDAPFQQKLRSWEAEWVRRTDVFPLQPVGDSVTLAQALLVKYRPILASEYEPVISLTTGKPTSASTGTALQHDSSKAVTGIASRTSFWCGEPLPQWLMVDLQSPQLLQSIHVFFYWDGKRSYRYSIETSLDSFDWTKVVDAETNTMPASAEGELHQFPAKIAKFIRVNLIGNSANQAAHILDLRAFA
jgi:alpha-N-acetylglucosaminidase